MVTLNHARSSINATAFDDVWVQRSLYQEFCIGDSTRMFFKDPNESFTDRFALCFWFGDALQLFKEPCTSIHVNQFNTHVALKRFNNLRTFVFAHETNVYIDARELIADCLMH